MEAIVGFIAVILALFCAQVGLRAGAFVTLRQMLGAIFALLLALRVLYPVARLVNQTEPSPFPLLACGVFWFVFALVWIVVMKLCDYLFEAFEAVQTSILDRLLGAVFGLVTGSIVGAAVLMSFALLAPLLLGKYHPEAFPFPADALVPTAYRYVETQIARVPEGDAARTKLPALPEALNEDPTRFWQ